MKLNVKVDDTSLAIKQVDNQMTEAQQQAYNNLMQR